MSNIASICEPNDKRAIRLGYWGWLVYLETALMIFDPYGGIIDEDRTAILTMLKRKPYIAPAIISEEVFETLALTCGKAAGPYHRFGPLQS